MISTARRNEYSSTLINGPVLVGTTKAGGDGYFYPDRHTLKDLQIMVERIQHFGGVPTAAALGMLGRESKVVTVQITPTQSDRLCQLLPPAFIDEEMTLLTTRVKAPRDTLEMVLDYLDDETAIEYVLSGGDAQTDEEMAFAERQVKRSMKSLRQKIKSAVR